jgi:hypothetical protein
VRGSTRKEEWRGCILDTAIIPLPKIPDRLPPHRISLVHALEMTNKSCGWVSRANKGTNGKECGRMNRREHEKATDKTCFDDRTICILENQRLANE